MTDRELYEEIDVVEFLTELGIRKVRDTGGGEVEFSCPFPGHSGLDKNPSATMSTVERPIPDEPNRTYPKTSFYCFTCNMKGTAITFLSEYEQVSPIVAKRLIRERFAPDYVEDDSKFLEQIKKNLEVKEQKAMSANDPILDESVLEKFYLNWPAVYDEWMQTDGEWEGYFFNRGFEPETLMDFEIGYDDISERFTIPIRDPDGNLLGFKARAWWPDARPKYKALGDKKDDNRGYGFETYKMSHPLFALHIAKEVVDPYRPLIVREGELNVMMLHQQGFTNAVGISGNMISHKQKLLIKKYSDSAIFWFDDWSDTLRAASLFDESMPISLVKETERDPADSTKEENGMALRNTTTLLKIINNV